MSKTPYELWTGKKPSIKHFRIWGCPAEAKPYRPSEKKLELRTVTCYFVGYSEKSRGYKFYDPTTRSIYETGNAQFFEEVEFVGRDKSRDIVFEEKSISLPTVIASNQEQRDDVIQLPFATPRG